MALRVLVALAAALALAQPAAAGAPLLTIDDERYVSRFDLRYDRLMDEPRKGLPIGNGRMGSLVHATPSALEYPINRVDVFQSGAASNRAVDDPTDRCCNTGDVTLDFGSEVFQPGVRQHLSFYDATATVAGRDVTARTLVSSNRDVMAIAVRDRRTGAGPVHVDLDMTAPEHSRLERRGDAIVLEQAFDAPSPTGIAANDHHSASATAVAVTGAHATASTVDADTMRLTVAPGARRFEVRVGTAATLDRGRDVAGRALAQLARGTSFDRIHRDHARWWRDYWARSFVHTPGRPEMEEKWVTYFYYAGSAFRGDFPAKFNGLLWQSGNRPWGAQFWGFNQGSQQYAMETANHLELLDPLFRMTARNLERYAIAARQQWDSRGIHIGQTESYDGPEVLPEHIASELRDLLRNGTAPSAELLAFARGRNARNSRWNWLRGIDRGAPPVGFTSHWVVDAAVVASLYWNRYLYTRDERWLRHEAYPVIKGVAEFYAHFPNLVKEADGRYHVHRTAWAETVWAARDSITTLTMMRGVLPVAIRAARQLRRDEHLIPRWREILENLAPYPTSDMPDQVLAPPHPEGRRTFAVARQPVVWQNGTGTVWDWWVPQPLFFDVLNLESADRALLRTLDDTLDAHPAMRMIESGELFGRDGHTWSRFLVNASRMGRADIVEKGLPILLEKTVSWNEQAEDHPNRLNFSDGPYLSLQELGIFAESLQSPLLQSLAPDPAGDPVIHVAPGWPLGWDASFRLLAKGGFVVQAAIEDGAVAFAELESQRGGVALVANPWPEADVYRGGRKRDTVSGDRIELPTRRGERIVLVPRGADPRELRRDLLIRSIRVNLP
jgi:hypothetical protein